MTEANGNSTPAGDEQSAEKQDFSQMVVTTERLSDVEQRLDVEIPWSDIQPKLDEAYRELSRGVALKGFRKGKVPKRMIVQLFGKHVNKEVAQRLVQESIEQATGRAGIKPVGEPKLDLGQEELLEGESFKYSATVEVVPEVQPRDYFGVEVRAQRGGISDEDVQVALRQKQRELTAYKTVEGRDTRAGDVLLVDVMGKAGDEVIDLEQRSVELAEEHPVEPLPGLAAALTGLPCDVKEREITLDLPLAALERKGGKGKGGGAGTVPAKLLVTVHDVKQKVVPELDDDLAKDSGEAETLDGLRLVLRQKLEQEDEKRARDHARQLMVEEIVKRNDIPVVPALVERYLEQRVILQKMMLGMDPKQVTAEDQLLKDHMRPEAELTVKSGMLLEAIAAKEQVEVTEADLEVRLSEVAASRGQNLARIKAEYEKDGQLEALRRRLVEEKTLDLLESKATLIIEDKKDEPAEASAGAEAEPGEGA